MFYCRTSLLLWFLKIKAFSPPLYVHHLFKIVIMKNDLVLFCCCLINFCAYSQTEKSQRNELVFGVIGSGFFNKDRLFLFTKYAV
jgi:hypothetical protein